MDFFNDLIERAEEDRSSVLAMLVSPLVHVAVCDGVDFEESEWIRPFRETLEVSVDIVAGQVTDDDYRKKQIKKLSIWLARLAPEEKNAVLTALRMICTDVATASSDEDGNAISLNEHLAMKEVGDILGW
ncbi:hypothetical protein P4B35_01330 [Pontiellaceae bacterium B12227]|nr:hypothetical protein [Pontiellaceae bacterium B12227]